MLTTILLLATVQTCVEPLPEQPVMGHRGSGSSKADNPFAENTLPSFENAFSEGADYVELDVQLTRDSQVALMHDFSVDKTTNLTGCVADFDYATLATADATVGSGATEKVGVPLLREALQLAKAKGKKVNIEIKVNKADEKACANTDVPALVDAVVAEVKAESFAAGVVFSSFDFETAKLVKQKLPEAKSGFLSAEGGDVLVQQAKDAKAAGLDTLNPLYLVLTSNEQTHWDVRQPDLEIIPWTVNDKAAMATLFESRVDALITDDVPAAVAARQAARDKFPGGPCKDMAVNDKGGCHASPEHGAPWMLAVLALLAILRLRRS